MIGMPKNVWLEMHSEDCDACDVIVEMENGAVYTAQFVTFPYLRRQMELTYNVSQGLRYAPAVRYCAMDTPHLLVETLDRDTIEDTIDALLALDTFESLFTLVVQDEPDAPDNARIITSEMRAVILNDVLVVADNTVA